MFEVEAVAWSHLDIPSSLANPLSMLVAILRGANDYTLFPSLTVQTLFINLTNDSKIAVYLMESNVFSLKNSKYSRH